MTTALHPFLNAPIKSLISIDIAPAVWQILPESVPSLPSSSRPSSSPLRPPTRPSALARRFHGYIDGCLEIESSPDVQSRAQAEVKLRKYEEVRFVSRVPFLSPSSLTSSAHAGSLHSPVPSHQLGPPRQEGHVPSSPANPQRFIARAGRVSVRGSRLSSFFFPPTPLRHSLRSSRDSRLQQGSIQWNGPTLFIKGSRSEYINEDRMGSAKAFFPQMVNSTAFLHFLSTH
jgi:hypothetical protein